MLKIYNIMMMTMTLTMLIRMYSLHKLTAC